MSRPPLTVHVSEVYRRIYVGYVFKLARGRFRAFMHDGTPLGESAQGVAIERIQDAWDLLTPITRYKEARRRAIERMKTRALEKGGEAMGDRLARTVIKNCLLEQDSIVELLFLFWELQRSRGLQAVRAWPPKESPLDPDEIRRQAAAEARAEERQKFAALLVSIAPDLAAAIHKRMILSGHENDPQTIALETEIER